MCAPPMSWLGSVLPATFQTYLLFYYHISRTPDGGSVVDELTHAGFREQGQARSGHLHLPKVRPEKTMERSDNEKKITPLCFIVGRYMEPGSVF